jgi:hypothetical protein
MNSPRLQGLSNLQSHPLAHDIAPHSDSESETNGSGPAAPSSTASQITTSPRSSASTVSSERDTLERPASACGSAAQGGKWVVSFAAGTKKGSPGSSAAVAQNAASSTPVPAANAPSTQWVSEGWRTHAGEPPYRGPARPHAARSHRPAAFAFFGAVVGATLGAALGGGVAALAALAGLGLAGVITVVSVGLCIGAVIGCLVGLARARSHILAPTPTASTSSKADDAL